ncbi:MAG: hypothetical protein LBV51_03410, partial [Acholeplasmatales bacterium]|nr:hypothetical protein [Acholeplasmatales bacterium]
MEEIKLSEDRLNILERIKQFEKEGRFDEDVEQDPPSEPLLPEEVDYLNRKFTSKLKTTLANRWVSMFYKSLIKNKVVIYKGVTGLENLKNF